MNLDNTFAYDTLKGLAAKASESDVLVTTQVALEALKLFESSAVSRHPKFVDRAKPRKALGRLRKLIKFGCVLSWAVSELRGFSATSAQHMADTANRLRNQLAVKGMSQVDNTLPSFVSNILDAMLGKAAELASVAAEAAAAGGTAA